MSRLTFVIPNYLTLFLLVCVLTLSDVSACNNQSLTFEQCAVSSDCLGYEPRFPEVVCSRQKKNGKFTECNRNNTQSDCICFPSYIKFCEQHDECPDRQYCGVSPTTGAKVCLGCKAINDDRLNFKPVKNVSEDRCNPVETHPPCGSTLDYCSPTMPCQNNLLCMTRSGGEYFDCVGAASPCRCGRLEPSNENLLQFQPCNSDSDCSSAREACAFDVRSQKNVCVSCDIARTDPFLMFNGTSNAKCDALNVTRPQPRHYFPGSNGLTFDYCNSDNECIGDRKCSMFTVFTETKKKTGKCKGSGSLCFCHETLKNCSSGNDCENGESCANLEMLDVKKKCISNAILAERSTREYEIIKKFKKTEKGKLSKQKLTNDQCKFDWDCRGDRRCTYVGESWGRCAGRRACTCKPMITQPCSTHGECVSGEVCVRYADNSTDAFCTSANSKVFNVTSGTVTFINETTASGGERMRFRGFTQDPCSSTSDCSNGRKCMHIFKNGTECAGHSDALCTCLPNEFQDCKRSPDCEDGEVCVKLKDAHMSNATCMSRDAFDIEQSGFLKPLGLPTPLPTPIPSTPSATPSVSVEGVISSNLDGEPSESPEADESCVHVNLLSDFHSDSLVYRKARRAAVLCDGSGSCATPGHIVVYNGNAMSMASYCARHAENACARRVALVNSPRMKHALRVPSLTAGLLMTAHAARFGSSMEEALISALVNHLSL